MAEYRRETMTDSVVAKLQRERWMVLERQHASRALIENTTQQIMDMEAESAELCTAIGKLGGDGPSRVLPRC